jgi:condensin-2 complex subunit H2
MEVLYWKHVNDQLETLRKLQRREASTHKAKVWEAMGPKEMTVSSDAFSGQMAERWLPRAEEKLWPAEEDRLEDSLEDLGVAGLSWWGWFGGWRGLSTWCQLPVACSMSPQMIL